MLRVDNLHHVYPNGTRALESVSLEVEPGMFGLLGPNGAGKSTLMRCIATLQVPTSGSIQFGSIDVLADPEALRRTLGYLPQDFGVYPRVSAYEMLDHIAVLKGYGAGGERRGVVEALDELLDIGVFTAEPGTKGFAAENVLYLERQRVRTGKQTLTVVVDREPRYVGVDPYNKYVDRNSNDNVMLAGRR